MTLQRSGELKELFAALFAVSADGFTDVDFE
jgi:hypothetical protein